MATPAAGASIATQTPPPVVLAPLPLNKKDFPTVSETVKHDLALTGKLNSQYRQLLNGFIKNYENPVEAKTREEVLKRLIEKAKAALENPQKVTAKEAHVKKPGIEQKVEDLTVRVNTFFGEVSSAVKAFTNTKEKDDLENEALKEKAKKNDIKLIDRNKDHADKFIAKNNELMNEFIKLYNTLNHKINSKKKLIAKHIQIDDKDAVTLKKLKMKFGFSDKKVKDHFDKQDKVLKIREESLKNLNILNSGITNAFETAQREINYFLDCWVTKSEVSRTKWRMGMGYKTDPDLLKKMNRIENIKNLLPKPVGKPAAAAPEKDPKAEKNDAAPQAGSVATPTPTPPAAAGVAPVNPPADGEKKKKKHKHHKIKAEA